MSNQTVTTYKNKFQNALSCLSANWHFMRWLRLGLGLFLLWQLIQRPDILTGLVAAFFLFQAITNTGCCGASGWSIPAGDSKASCNPENFKDKEIK